MCRLGNYHDFHGIGVANLIFGLMCIILPDLALHEEANGAYDYDPATGDFVKATDAITVINGLLFLAVGICSMVLARRWMENLSLHRLMQITLILAIISVVICPITFALNVISANDASDWMVPRAAVDAITDSPTDDDTSTSSSDSTTSTTFVSVLTTGSTAGSTTVYYRLTTILTFFMSVFRFFEYRIAICSAFTLISFGSFFMNIVLIIFIARTKNFHALHYASTNEPQLDDVPHVAPRMINFQKMDQAGGNVVIQPLPSLPGPNTDHYTNGGTMINNVRT